MKLYCANCGANLTIIRKALPKLGVIVNLVQYHECLPVVEGDIKFNFDAKPAPSVEGMNKCVQSLNALEPAKSGIPLFDNPNKEIPAMMNRKPFGGVGTDDLRDRRFDHEKDIVSSTAPSSIADQIRQMQNSIPANDLKGIEEGKSEGTDSEMGD
jgi:hypothetical protein